MGPAPGPVVGGGCVDATGSVEGAEEADGAEEATALAEGSAESVAVGSALAPGFQGSRRDGSDDMGTRGSVLEGRAVDDDAGVL